MEGYVYNSHFDQIWLTRLFQHLSLCQLQFTLEELLIDIPVYRIDQVDEIIDLDLSSYLHLKTVNLQIHSIENQSQSAIITNLNIISAPHSLTHLAYSDNPQLTGECVDVLKSTNSTVVQLNQDEH